MVGVVMKHSIRACEIVRDRATQMLNKGEYPNGTDFKVYIVACSYILGNEKYWISTSLPDGKYYEVTYNGGSKEFYLDEYVRIHNETIKE